MGTSKQYNSALVKYNCTLYLPTPYFRGMVLFKSTPIDPCCHSNHSKVAKFCTTTNGNFKGV